MSREMMPVPASPSEQRPLVGTATPDRRGGGCTSTRVAIVAASTVGALLMLSGLSRGASLSGSRRFSVVARYEHWKVKKENELLKAQIEALTRARNEQQQQEMKDVEAKAKQVRAAAPGLPAPCAPSANSSGGPSRCARRPRLRPSPPDQRHRPRGAAQTTG